MKPGAEDVRAMGNRVLVLDALYALDGRNDKNHPYHHTYSGLYRKFVSK